MTLALLTQREIWPQQIYWGVLPNIQEINHSCLPRSLPGSTKKGGTPSTNSFYEVSISLILKLDMGHTRKVPNMHQREVTLTKSIDKPNPALYKNVTLGLSWALLRNVKLVQIRKYTNAIIH